MFSELRISEFCFQRDFIYFHNNFLNSLKAFLELNMISNSEYLIKSENIHIKKWSQNRYSGIKK